MEWRKIETLLIGLGADVFEGSGSRVAFKLNGERWDAHRPHPDKEALKYRVKEARKFLTNAGITP